MNEATLLVITALALLLALATIYGYEQALRRARDERDHLLDVIDQNVDDMRRMAKDRHPSSQSYGGGNLRVVR
jgi:hypothetical protein